MSVALIADIVGSRLLPDRSLAQETIERVIDTEQAQLSVAVRPLLSTVGDEFQGTFDRVDHALSMTLRLQLALPDGLALRFGIGIGPVHEIQSTSAVITDGPGWWAAREAITKAASLQPPARSRTRVEGARSGVEVPVGAVNAYLSLRDQLISGMSARERRVTLARIKGVSQAETARREGVSQPSVSKALQRSGASAILLGLADLENDFAAPDER